MPVCALDSRSRIFGEGGKKQSAPVGLSRCGGEPFDSQGLRCRAAAVSDINTQTRTLHLHGPRYERCQFIFFFFSPAVMASALTSRSFETDGHRCCSIGVVKTSGRVRHQKIRSAGEKGRLTKTLHCFSPPSLGWASAYTEPKQPPQQSAAAANRGSLPPLCRLNQRDCLKRTNSGSRRAGPSSPPSRFRNPFRSRPLRSETYHSNC